MAGQKLGSGDAGTGDYVAQDSPPKIVPRGGREASLDDLALKDAM